MNFCKSADVIIIGSGAVGNAAAYYLSKGGSKVLVLEDHEIGHGGSSRNGGGVRQSARADGELPLALYAVKNQWPTLSEELGVDVEYHQEGNLRLAKTEAHIRFLENMIAKNRAKGLELSLLKRDEVKSVCPCISDEVIAASWCPTDGHANPMKTTLAFYKRARELGAQYITGEHVVELRKFRGAVRDVVTDLGNVYSADAVILAAGLGSRPIAQTVDIDVPMVRRVIEALVTEAVEPLFPQMLGTAAADFYGHQTDHGSFVFGGSCGGEPYRKEQELLSTSSINASYVCRGILSYFPMLKDIKVVRSWAGWSDKTPDGEPYLSTVDEVPGLVLACGFSGHGFGIAPAAGLIAAELAAGSATTVDVSPLRYDRFVAKDLPGVHYA